MGEDREPETRRPKPLNIRFDTVANEEALDHVAPPKVTGSTRSRWTLRLVMLTYLTFLLILPVGLVFWKTFEDGSPVPNWVAAVDEARKGR